MKLGYAEMLLLFAGVVSFQNLTWALSIAGLSVLIAFFKYAIQLQEKKESKQNAEDSLRVLNEQAEEFGRTLGTLLRGATKKDVKSNNKKYNNDPDVH